MTMTWMHRTADVAPSDDFFKTIYEAQSTWDTPMDNDGDDHMMTMLMDGFQCNGVEPEVACTVASQLVRHPGVTEVYGRGAIVYAASHVHEGLNVAALNALDWRTKKEHGQYSNRGSIPIERAWVATTSSHSVKMSPFTFSLMFNPLVTSS